ncbi:unnamed protein product [Heterobilharzia americana]|nr:unnamed protein product [Heterobilharzia americana]
MEISDRSSWRSFQLGCMGGAISTVLCQPLDVIKTRLQTKVVLGLPPLGVRQAISQIYTNDLAIGGRITSVSHVLEVCGRLRNFWTGTYPSLWRCVPGIGGYFMCLDILQDVTTRWDFLTTTTYTPTTAVRSFLLAFTARGIVAFCLDPFVVIKTQLESGLYAEDRRSMLRTFRRVYSSAKWKGLYSGVWASIMRDCPYSGLYLATYTSLLHYTGLYSPFQKNTVMRVAFQPANSLRDPIQQNNLIYQFPPRCVSTNLLAPVELVI